MRSDAEDSTGEALATLGRPARDAASARWLRRHRLDEIPQLWNVLAGADEPGGTAARAPRLRRRVLERRRRLRRSATWCRPASPVWRRCNGDYHSTPENKVRYDLAYIANWSLWLDCTILLRTVKVVLTSPSV